MKYIKAYMNICNNAKYRINNDEYYEKHHIQPKSLGGSNDKSNLVLLTAREHYICHFLLYKHFKSIHNVKSRNSMACAFNLMCANTHGKRYTSKTFSIARTAMSESFKGKSHTDEHKQKISKSVNDSMTDEVKLKKSIAQIGKKHSDERNKQKSEYFKNRPQQQVECPHCHKIGGLSNMKRYHFDKCKTI